MAAGEKKGFLSSGAFKLILAWLALGVVSTVAVFAAAPKMLHSCEVWAEEYRAAHPGEAKAEGGEEKAGMNQCLLAEEEGNTHPNLTASFYAITNMRMATAWSIPNFLILITILVYFAGDAVNQNLKTRRDDLEKAIGEAEKARREAEALRADYEAKLADLGNEIERLKAEMRAQGEEEKGRIVKQAEVQAERIRNEADFTARQEVLVAQYRLREEAARLAVQVAEQVLREVITDKDRDRLFSDYLSTVKEQVK
jgi:F-type H+-transporting ATPase subunit b